MPARQHVGAPREVVVRRKTAVRKNMPAHWRAVWKRHTAGRAKYFSSASSRNSKARVGEFLRRRASPTRPWKNIWRCPGRQTFSIAARRKIGRCGPGRFWNSLACRQCGKISRAPSVRKYQWLDSFWSAPARRYTAVHIFGGIRAERQKLSSLQRRRGKTKRYSAVFSATRRYSRLHAHALPGS